MEFFIGAFIGYSSRSAWRTALRALLAVLFILCLDQLILGRLGLEATTETYDLWVSVFILTLIGAEAAYFTARWLRAKTPRNSALPDLTLPVKSQLTESGTVGEAQRTDHKNCN
jgi:hypothetical protein